VKLAELDRRLRARQAQVISQLARLEKGRRELAALRAPLEQERRQLAALLRHDAPEAPDHLAEVSRLKQTIRSQEECEEILAHALDEEASKAKRERAEVDRELDVTSVRRGELAGAVSSHLLCWYETLVTEGRADPLRAVQGDHCGACHVVLPRAIEQALRQAPDVRSCPKCRAMLYHAVWLKER
jgi:predicted  nucleic acid-binding Zn-ribbon protein